MSEQNKELVRRFIDEVFRKKNIGIIDYLFAPGFISHYVPPGTIQDVEAFKKSIRSFLTAFPDIEITIEDLIAEDDKVVAHVTGGGTHTGNFQAFPPTGKRVILLAMIIWRISDSKFVERWEIMDQLGMLQQLGIIPKPSQE
jgi:predicted ester cyclase